MGVTVWHGFKLQERAREKAQASALTLAQYIAHGRVVIETIARRTLQTMALNSAVQERNVKECARLLKSALVEYGEPYLNFVALDLNGQAFAQAQAQTSEKLHNYADRLWFKQILRGEASSTEIIFNKTTRESSITIARPVQDSNGTTLSMLSITLELSEALNTILSVLPMPPGSVVTVLDLDGTIMVRMPQRPELIGTNRIDEDIRRLIRTQREGKLVVKSADNAERIVAFTPMHPEQEKSPIIYVSFDHTSVQTEIWRGIYQQLMVLLATGTLGLATAWFLGGLFFMKPVQEITQFALLLGQGNLEERTKDTYPVNEYSQLAKTFNNMADQLKARTLQLKEKAEALTQSNLELQQEVDARQRAEVSMAQLQREVDARLRAEDSLALHVEKLQQSNEELEQFAYVASHDLQEPLRIIHSYLQLIERRYKELIDEEGARFIKATKDAAERMRALIHGLLDYSRLSTKAQPFAAVQTEEVFAEAMESLGEAVADNQALVHHEPLPPILGDRTQIAQLFQNLLSNAMKFHLPESTPEVWVTAQRDGTLWQFTVRDNGIGISPEYHERIFALFQRLHTRAHYPGTGIGLTICKKIVERHNGRIWLESDSGAGSAFHFTLQAVEETSS
ncbi:MAG: hypothetical protein KKE73_14540 [Proteobacteria bacterium]|nr:hypothetical protein [Pseudomonadota bacterium]